MFLSRASRRAASRRSHHFPTEKLRKSSHGMSSGVCAHSYTSPLRSSFSSGAFARGDSEPPRPSRSMAFQRYSAQATKRSMPRRLASVSDAHGIRPWRQRPGHWDGGGGGVAARGQRGSSRRYAAIGGTCRRAGRPRGESADGEVSVSCRSHSPFGCHRQSSRTKLRTATYRSRDL
jgi:hypothetical protein